jgi:hypothetical protein
LEDIGIVGIDRFVVGSDMLLWTWLVVLGLGWGCREEGNGLFGLGEDRLIEDKSDIESDLLEGVPGDVGSGILRVVDQRFPEEEWIWLTSWVLLKEGSAWFIW